GEEERGGDDEAETGERDVERAQERVGTPARRFARQVAEAADERVLEAGLRLGHEEDASGSLCAVPTPRRLDALHNDHLWTRGSWQRFVRWSSGAASRRRRRSSASRNRR